MNSSTKNIQSQQTLIKIVNNAFPKHKCVDTRELTDGYFNVAYNIKLSDGKERILKIAPPKEARVMSYEINMMEREVMSMQIARAMTNLPIPEVLYYDDSCTLCSSSYFFMEKLEGSSLYSLRDRLTKQEKHKLQIEIGKLNYKLNSITGEKFGYLGRPNLQGKHWSYVFQKMLYKSITDAESMSIDLKIPISELWRCMERDCSVFESVEVPQFVHWDLWIGNIFIENGKITGLIDWERSLWGDPLMEVGFRTYQQNLGFFEGYGIKELSDQEYRRALWYDIYLASLAAQECDYRQYDTKEMYNWAIKILTDKFMELYNAKKIESLDVVKRHLTWHGRQA